jgi:predicted transcriptional regulator
MAKKPGPAPHRRTALAKQQVVMFKAAGYTTDQIAHFLMISAPTLRKHYRDELDRGQMELNAKVMSTITQIASDPNHKQALSAAIFWAKTQMGFRETDRMEHVGADGNPIQLQVAPVEKLNASDMTPEQRQALREIIKQTIATKAEQPAIEASYEKIDEEDEELDEVIDED